MKKSDLIYIPVILYFLIQSFDKDDDYLIVQYLLVGIVIIALIVTLIKRFKKNSS